MPEIVLAALDTAGLGWLILTTIIAGVVYGFAGFGAALIFMPVAVIFLPPAVAIAAFSVSALSSFVTVFPRAVPLVDRQAVTVLILSAAVAASLGFWVLRVADVTAIRWTVVTICAVTLIALIAGWRYAVTPSLRTRIVIGCATGFVGGVSGLLGPIMVLFQLAGRDSVATSRATTVVFLTSTSLLLLPLMYLQGLLTLEAVVVGALLLVPYGAGSLLGQALFQPRWERFYRLTAYVIIGAATLMGVPLWDKV
ncbi:MAG: sulfite exporter TauE/SafE family protein [Marivita sp.]|uniref:sulfite exporter TauE/SafE family protein n=1 Tax=Marivita sp. TaxID=2003365 RepID=UPI0025C4D701|nr:sulfite exporter TauE/SafE family protein [Marivita sp.]MCI5111511.1 sulfite exporter TauE/SafE family protein [Marivita sp.]